MPTENLYTPNCIRTRSGIYFNILSPTLEMISIKDIAWALSSQCRFGAHLGRFFTVAEHCINVANDVERGLKLQALLHDASEAYLLDLPTPVKKLLPEYYLYEGKIMLLIAEKFGFQYPLSQWVLDADKRALQNEWDTYMINNTPPKPLGRRDAYCKFLQMFNKFYQPT
jgi:5'-deoxynucleotidase YfbR-like HD superfamily hydrolase